MELLLESYYKNIKGIKKISSKQKGPILVISACTHGGETVGLEIINYLIKNINIENKILIGEIYLVLSNIKAYQKGALLKKQGDINYMTKSRYIDENLNRCCSINSLKEEINYERKRANELSIILKKSDYHIDIHSTKAPTKSMFIHTKNSHKELGDVFNTDETYINLAETVIGKPLLDITSRHGGIGMAIETGGQENKDGYKVGIDNILRLLIRLKMIDKSIINNNLILKNKINEKYYITSSIIVENKSFIPKKIFKHLDKIKKGNIIASMNNKDIKIKEDFFIIMPSNNHIGEEFCFLAKKI